MELFARLLGDLLLFVYHCFDRLVIHGYLSGLSRPEQVVYFFRDVVGVPVVDKTVLSQRTGDYRQWVEAFARNHQIPSSGRKKVSAKRITSGLGSAAWSAPAAMASISFSKAWNRAPLSVAPFPSSLPRIQTI